ncbi:hypothetical protein ID47_03945 [Candidatus Paracaedibacter acanthamoebae]|uniref:Uncharacterized protein n=2 Tax=Candidatus Odyssella acanthamoebae TaxID=91604 RepID=A0A077AUK5_9PROT|nr:hypothetical protein ID47_03945 [Candidatus Paracaedibacter acanthamoebae]
MENAKEFKIPPSIKKNAEKGLKLREKFGKGSTQVGIRRGHQLVNNDSISLEIIKKMSAYFARHEVDKQAKEFGNDENPSKGYIAWMLWGGDEAKEWTDKIKKEHSK